MKFNWILGWAIPANWFGERVREVFPDAGHEFIVPEPDWAEKLTGLGPADWTLGYSLGARLLLEAAPGIHGRVALLAPFLGFPSEARQGGRVSVTQVRFLARWLERDRRAALADFYQRAGLHGISPQDAGSTECLLWGLEILGNQRPLPGQLIDDFRKRSIVSYCGEKDPLLDARAIAGLLPTTQVVGAAGHDPLPLMRAFASQVP